VSKLKLLISAATALLPWGIRRPLLQTLCGYRIHKTAFISRFAAVFPERLEMGPNARIGSFTVCKGLNLLQLEERATIGARNWISAHPLRAGDQHFALDPGRKPQLLVGRHAAITSQHIIDCTDEVRIGPFSTLAGFRSQILTHSIDLGQSRQRCKPVHIGSYCFLGTACVLLAGSRFPDRSVLGANSLLLSALDATDYLYGGSPAKPLKPIEPGSKYFSRDSGYVW
jgi:acetyltransferase-like isoleucine patch superfamily enzyme